MRTSGGWLFQRNALATGFANQNQLVSNFLGSPEWVLKFGNPANSEFVRLLYRYILLREGTPAEVNFQVNALNAGSTRVALAAAFLNTTEFRIGTGARLTAFLLHATLLSRDGLAAETASKIARLNASVPAKTLVQEILDNPEFGARTSGN